MRKWEVRICVFHEKVGSSGNHQAFHEGSFKTMFSFINFVLDSFKDGLVS